MRLYISSVEGVDAINQRLDQYRTAIRKAVMDIATYFAPVIEQYAKNNAIWTDRTGNARQGLEGFAVQIATDIVHLYLKHKMEYGKWLEVRWSGRYSIILPAFEAHYAEITRMLKETFK